ncbi:galactitol-1-phosphate 5-dehydrogenase [Thermoanaerobacter siderophilus]|uniref:Theronine dehydrogenase-like Zn-dependent dehydrogenase n=1 Tax=Thermoanaerobacter siderophilus SR4 TaxID=880478 RepID=I8QWZ3_9THEO|nr:galactitol-1-phosphate 5-dehydrogenase [Thermoanaerobacter siderophilus]EIV99437.1 theronine dehydrogenase-like Zn-dependent dehydrogenase [Thermoanaerobacter siderophilus SR4]
MKAARFYGVRDIRIEHVPQPKIESNNDVIIKVKAAGICGSDLSKYGRTGPHKQGEIMGHEFSGIVHEIGENVKNLKVGDHVTVCPVLPCFKCDYCLQGKFSQCENITILGNNDNDGGFAEYVKVNRNNVIKIPESLDFETAATVEPAAVAAHGLYRTNLKVGDVVAILGAGPIGLFLIQWAKIFGASQVIAIDIFEEKLAIAKEVGADICINSKNVDIIKEIQRLTNFKGVDVAIESAGTAFTCSQILTLAKKGGTVLFAGVPYSDVSISREHFEKIIRNELKVVGTWFSNSFPFPGREWFVTIQKMEEGVLRAKPIITHRITLDELPAIFEKMYKRDEFFGKVIVNM